MKEKQGNIWSWLVPNEEAQREAQRRRLVQQIATETAHMERLDKRMTQQVWVVANLRRQLIELDGVPLVSMSLATAGYSQ